jgi:DNA-binding HxlR family transcriptional regulator
MLTLELKVLEQEGLVSRTVYAEVPPRVEYALTEDGLRVREVLCSMRDFGRWLQHRPRRNVA